MDVRALPRTEEPNKGVVETPVVCTDAAAFDDTATVPDATGVAMDVRALARTEYPRSSDVLSCAFRELRALSRTE